MRLNIDKGMLDRLSNAETFKVPIYEDQEGYLDVMLINAKGLIGGKPYAKVSLPVNSFWGNQNSTWSSKRDVDNEPIW